MNQTNPPPTFLVWLVALLAPAHLREDLLGDMEEQFRARRRSGAQRVGLRYGLDVLKLVPFLVSSRLAGARSKALGGHVLFAGATILLVIAWEGLLVQKTAWPITADLMSAFPVAGRPLFFTIYAALYLAGLVLIAVLYCLSREMGSTEKGALRCPALTILGTALSVPLLFSLVFPQPLDSTAMRLCLLGLIWSGVIGMQIGLKRMSDSAGFNKAR